jgi:hypothetical protein
MVCFTTFKRRQVNTAFYSSWRFTNSLHGVPTHPSNASRKNWKETKGLFLGRGRFMCSCDLCLVAWSRACMPKKCVGLGIKNLHVQNICLLLKFSFKTLQQENIPWRRWISELSPYPLSQGANSSSLGKTIYKNIETMPTITPCSVISGENTLFWQDRWLLPEPLGKTHPAIYSRHL